MIWVLDRWPVFADTDGRRWTLIFEDATAADTVIPNAVRNLFPNAGQDSSFHSE